MQKYKLLYFFKFFLLLIIILLQKFGKPTDPNDRRMPTDRCGRLMAVAIAHKLDEAWIAAQPNLTFYYLVQYAPTFFRK